MDPLPTLAPSIPLLLFFVALFLSTLHVSVIAYHWYRYTDQVSLAHKIVFSYGSVSIVCLLTLAVIAFTS